MFPNIRTAHRRVSNLDAEERKNRRDYYWGLGIALIIALALFILVLGWALNYGGGLAIFGTSPGLLGIHMVFAVFFVLIFNAFSSLLYRTLPKFKKSTTKLVHAGFHFLVVIGSIIAFSAAIEMHNLGNPPKHFYSLHSWLGLTTLCILYFQYLAGFIIFLLKISTPSFRSSVIAYHKVIGQIILYFACGAVLTGLFNESPKAPKNSTAIPVSGIQLNIGALLTVCFTFTVIYLLTSNKYRRPIYEEVEPLLVDPPPPPQMHEYYKQQQQTTYYGAGSSKQ